jgi:hypothetical protein
MRSLMTAGVAFMALGVAGTAFGQTLTQDPAPAATAAPQTTPMPSPAAVGKDKVPVPPRDRAFDPSAQQPAMQHIGDITPPLRRIGKTSPISAVPGAPGPVVTLEPPTLRPIPGGTWQLTLNLSNNTARPIDARLACTFRNGDRPVADVNVLMRDVGAGDQVGADVAGPPVTTFVDSASCNILAPAIADAPKQRWPSGR